MKIEQYYYTEYQPLLNLATIFLAYTNTHGLLDIIEYNLSKKEIRLRNMLCPE